MPLIRSEQLQFPLKGTFTGSFEGAITGSILGTASYAISASYALSSSHADLATSASWISGSNVKGAVSASLTASYVYQAENARTASYTVFTQTSSYAESSSYANQFEVGNDLFVRGNISASALHIDVISSSITYSTGSNKFGDELTIDVQELTGSVGVTGSFKMDTASVAIIPNLTGSLYGTASWAVNALTAAYAANVPETSSYALQASASEYATTASYALSVSGGGNGTFTGNFSGSFTGSLQGDVIGSLEGTASYTVEALTSSYAVTASYVLGQPETASYAATASQALTASIATKVEGEGSGSFNGQFTGSILGTASYAFFANSGSYSTNAGHADTAGTASWAQQAISSSTAVSASIAEKAISSSYAVSSSAAEYSVNAGFSTASLSSSYAATASIAGTSDTASYVATSSWANNAVTASHAIDALTSSYALTASVMVGGTASGQFSGSFEGNVLGTSSWSETSSYAYFLLDTASYAWTASYIKQAETASLVISASYAAKSTTASFAETASIAVYAEAISASSLVGYTDRIESGSGYAKFINTASLEIKANLNVLERVSGSQGFTGYLYDTASQAETASFADSLRIQSGAVILDGGLTIFTKSSSLSGSEINNGLQFRNGGPTGDTWVVYSEDQDRSLRFGTTDATHSAYRINNYLHQISADNPVNIFSSADGGGGIIMASLIYEGQGQPNQVWGMWTTASGYAQYVTQSFIDNSGSFVGTASYASSVGADAITGDIARIASGSVTASISPLGGLQVNTNTTITGSLSVSNTITASNLVVEGTASIKYLYVEFESSSVIVSTGSNKFGDAFNDTQEFTGSVGITGSFRMDTASVAVIPNLTGSLYGTASWAINALTSSITLSSSYATQAASADLIDGGFY